jgi:TPP-dependent pyruvate/acetoin dehydrogenase alpha subunit
MQFDRKDLSNEQLVDFYKSILLPRQIEEKMLVLLRQGRISKWFSGIGQEAISVGATLALQDDEWIMPLHRNLGVFTTRKMPLHKLIRQWQGSQQGYSKGRERSFHFGTRDRTWARNLRLPMGYRLHINSKIKTRFRSHLPVKVVPVKEIFMRRSIQLLYGICL